MSYKVKTTCLHFSSFLFLLLLWRPVFSQSKPKPGVPEPSPYHFEALDQLLKQNQKALGNNFVALIWKDGKLVYEKHGSPDFVAKTQGPIAAAGNWMTAALVMTFVDEGKLSLDDKVTQYIPLFGKYMKGYITIRNCLTHTTGIKTEGDDGTRVLRNKSGTLEDEVNDYASKKGIGTNPGTEFFYSNLGPNIAARVLEVISKKSFDRLMMERIIRPCKMKGTSFTNEDGGATNAAGGARSTANDYINFLTMLMDKGMYEGKRVLSEKAVEEMEKAQFASLPVRSVPKTLQGSHFSFGLGNFILDGESGGGAPALICPSLLMTAPIIDQCRKYAAILIVQKPEEEQKKALFFSMKNLIDEAIGGCQ